MVVRPIRVCTPNRLGVAACAFDASQCRLIFLTPNGFEVARFMSRKIYVGNLPWSTTSADLEAMFAEHGAVSSAEVISDRETGRSRGFGFVEMESDEGMQAAVNALNGHEMNGRPLTVNEARERTPRSGGAPPCPTAWPRTRATSSSMRQLPSSTTTPPVKSTGPSRRASGCTSSKRWPMPATLARASTRSCRSTSPWA